MGVRKGDWKLYVERGKCKLFNLANDIHEDHDVSAQHPEVVKELVKIIYEQHTTPDVNEFKTVTLPQR